MATLHQLILMLSYKPEVRRNDIMWQRWWEQIDKCKWWQHSFRWGIRMISNKENSSLYNQET